MTRRELIDQQHRQHLEQSQLVGYWAKTQGITQRDLDSHPQIDDVILLLKFLDEYQTELTNSQRVYVWVMWDWCYRNKKPLSKRYLKALTKIIYRLQQVRNLKLTKRQKARTRIKALRTLTLNRL